MLSMVNLTFPQGSLCTFSRIIQQISQNVWYIMNCIDVLKNLGRHKNEPHVLWNAIHLLSDFYFYILCKRLITKVYFLKYYRNEMIHPMKCWHIRRKVHMRIFLLISEFCTVWKVKTQNLEEIQSRLVLLYPLQKVRKVEDTVLLWPYLIAAGWSDPKSTPLTSYCCSQCWPFWHSPVFQICYFVGTTI